MILENALTNLFTTKRSATTIGNNVSSFFGFGGAFTTGKTTKVVTQNAALTLSAFYNGIEILTNDIALPTKTIYKKEKGNRLPLPNHPANYLIAKRPNQYMTSFMFHKMMSQYAILKGNAYALIERNHTTAKPTAYQLITDRVEVIVSNSKLYYKVYYKKETITYDATDILHVPGFSFNGITGIGVIQHAANSLGVALAAQDYSSEYYNSKGLGSGYIKTDKELKPDAKTAVGSAFSAILSANNPWKVPVLDEGMSFHPIQITAAEAQFLTTSKHGISEVARWLNIPPHKLKALDNATFSNIENQEIQHYQGSVLPWITKFEQEYNSKLFTEAEKNTHFIKFNMSVIMRADLKSQAEYLSKMIHNGSMTRNEARKLLDMNAIDGLDEPLTPVNTQTIEQINAKLELINQQIKATA